MLLAQNHVVLAVKILKINNMNCKYCNEESELEHIQPAADLYPVMRDEQLCFSCAFWEVHARNHEKGDDAIIVDGDRYHDAGNTDKRGGFMCHGGRKFKIKMDDGRIIETNNLWHQGDIPEFFRERLKDNAIFV